MNWLTSLFSTEKPAPTPRDVLVDMVCQKVPLDPQAVKRDRYRRNWQWVEFGITVQASVSSYGGDITIDGLHTRQGQLHLSDEQKERLLAAVSKALAYLDDREQIEFEAKQENSALNAIATILGVGNDPAASKSS